MSHVEIQISRDYYRFTVRVVADGELVDSRPATIANIVRVRNRLTAYWSNHSAKVTAYAVPWPPEYNSGR